MPRFRFLPVLALLVAAAPLVRAQEKKGVPRTGTEVPRLAPFDDLIDRFVQEQKVPGAALAVARDGRLLYTRGFGFADPAAKTLVQPGALFRIASISKPITAAAILRLIEMGKLKLDDPAFPLLPFAPPPGTRPDPRLRRITIRHLLQHTGGWDRQKSFDPMFIPLKAAEALKVKAPAGAEDILRYMLGQPLDFDPGTRYAYSNFGYCVLGRIIERVSGQKYEDFVRKEVLLPLGMKSTRLGKSLERAEGEVRYFDPKGRTGPSVVGPNLGRDVPLPYGTFYLEPMDAHGGWIASAEDLVRFGSAFVPEKGKLLKEESLTEAAAPPRGIEGLKKDRWYGLGWSVRALDERRRNLFHSGALNGTASLLVVRWDGWCWAVLFNSRTNPQGEYLSSLIDPLLHQALAHFFRKN